MEQFSRRDLLQTLGAGTGAASGGWILDRRAAAGDSRSSCKPAAELRIPRWKRYVQVEDGQFLANALRSTEATGVRVGSGGFEDIRPNAAVTASAGSGPDNVAGCYDIVTPRCVRGGRRIAIGRAIGGCITDRGRTMNAEPLRGMRELARWQPGRLSTMEWICTTW